VGVAGLVENASEAAAGASEGLDHAHLEGFVEKGVDDFIVCGAFWEGAACQLDSKGQMRDRGQLLRQLPEM
jgi:hypothetical protein